MLRIHGGGWAASAPEDDDTLNDAYARACKLVVVSPE
jgi:acetyl esterase/lipase